MKEQDGKRSVNTVIDKKDTPLMHHVSFWSDEEIAKFLINEYNADIIIKDKLGRDIYCYDSSFGMKELYLPKADVNKKDGFGNSYLHYAVWDDDIKLVELLIKYNANVNVKNKEGQTPYSQAYNNQMRLLLRNAEEQQNSKYNNR